MPRTEQQLPRIIGLRVPPEIAARLWEAARADDRSASSLVRKFIIDGLEKLEDDDGASGRG